MASQKQIEANRRNAKKSTGPRSAAGKAVSSMNALKSGVDARSEIIRGEDPAAIEALTAEYRERFRPCTPEERRFVDTLIRGDWQLRRLATADAQLWERSMKKTLFLDEENPLGHVLPDAAPTFSRLQRRVNDIERSYRNALSEIERLLALREAPNPPSQTIDDSAASAGIGFVPQPAPLEDLPPATSFVCSSETPVSPPPSQEAPAADEGHSLLEMFMETVSAHRRGGESPWDQAFGCLKDVVHEEFATTRDAR